MRFLKYPSIENSSRIKAINQIQQQGFSDGTWCATNKIHGSNYSFRYDGDRLKCGNRAELLVGDGSNFYGSNNVYYAHTKRIANLYNYLKRKCEFREMALYGELFGGNYPHKDVEKVTNVKKIQSGVFYCPHNDFFLFDIVLFDDKKVVKFFDTDEVETLGTKFNFLSIDILYHGTLEQMLALNPIFKDETYKFFKLPEIENNMSEGFVLRPMKTSFLHDGSRVILKHKNPKFKEKAAKKERKLQKSLPPEAQDLLEEWVRYVTENRLHNVISHEYEFGQKDFGKLINLVYLDVYNSFVKDNKEAIDSMEKSMFKKVSKQVNQEVANLIRLHWQNIVDKNF